MSRRLQLLAVTLLMVPVVACGDSSDSWALRDTPATDSGGDPDGSLPVAPNDDGGADGAMTDGSGPMGVDGASVPSGDAATCTGPTPHTGLPTEDACVVTEAYGVFVSATAAPAGDGSRAKPFATLQAAVTAAKVANKRVYACAGTYAEALVLENGVSMFGYFACDGWTPSATRALVRSPTSPAARATNITTPTRVEGFDIGAPDFAGAAASGVPAKSSIGLVSENSAALRIVRTRIKAGVAQRGADGTTSAALTEGSANARGQSNLPAVPRCGTVDQRPACQYVPYAVAGGQGGVSSCRLNGSAVDAALNGGPGGTGGAGGSFFDVSTSGFPTWSVEVQWGDGSPNPATSKTARGSVNPAVATPGTAGAAGAKGSNGATIGTVSLLGYVPASGSVGSPGAPGMGGGGGSGTGPSTQELTALAGSYKGVFSASGAGGGAGGCAGPGGNPGGGGGASIAVVTVNGLVFEDAELVTSAGGGAGKASPGAAGTPGNAPGTILAGTTTDPLCAGAAGGAGGAGGVGGNGGAGPSIGIFYSGASPATTGVTFTLGAGGAGAPAVGVQPATPAGLQSSTLSF